MIPIHKLPFYNNRVNAIKEIAAVMRIAKPSWEKNQIYQKPRFAISSIRGNVLRAMIVNLLMAKTSSDLLQIYLKHLYVIITVRVIASLQIAVYHAWQLQNKNN